MGEALPKVSIIVPVFNDETNLPGLMESLRAQDYPRDRTEIILVDNNSTDRSLEVMHKYPEAVSLSYTASQGPAGTRNAGIEAAAGEILAFVDSDCIADFRWLGTGVKTLVEKGLDRVAGCVEFIASPDPDLYEIYDMTMNFQQDQFVDSGWSGSGNLFARREVFKLVGGFNPELYSHEDSEWGMRATNAGSSLGYAADAIVRHPTRKTLKALMLKWARTEYGAAQVYRRHGLLELHLWKKKANWRPLFKVWRQFPEKVRRPWRRRAGITLLANLLRLAGNLGNFLGYYNRCKWILKG